MVKKVTQFKVKPATMGQIRSSDDRRPPNWFVRPARQIKTFEPKSEKMMS